MNKREKQYHSRKKLVKTLKFIHIPTLAKNIEGIMNNRSDKINSRKFYWVEFDAKGLSSFTHDEYNKYELAESPEGLFSINKKCLPAPGSTVTITLNRENFNTP